MNWISKTPLVKKYGQPLFTNASKAVGKEIINATYVANDALEGKNVAESINKNYESSISNLKTQTENALQSSDLLNERNLASDDRLLNENTAIGRGLNKVKKAKVFVLKNKKTKQKVFDDIFNNL